MPALVGLAHSAHLVTVVEGIGQLAERSPYDPEPNRQRVVVPPKEMLLRKKRDFFVLPGGLIIVRVPVPHRRTSTARPRQKYIFEYTEYSSRMIQCFPATHPKFRPSGGAPIGRLVGFAKRFGAGEEGKRPVLDGPALTDDGRPERKGWSAVIKITSQTIIRFIQKNGPDHGTS